MTTPAVEDYLKAIYLLSREGEAVGTSAIAERLNIAPGSVTGMLKRLGEQGLVKHVRYYGARLTPRGEAQALRMIRRHRVLELFLVEVLGYTWDRVHDEAERLEHAASDTLVDRMAQVLGEPDVDPHGHPIPTAGGVIRPQPLLPLSELEPGRAAVLRRVSDDDPAALRRLSSLRLTPGARVQVVDAPADGPLRVRVDGAERSVETELAGKLQVELIDG